MPIPRLAFATVVTCVVLGIAVQPTGAAPQAAPRADATAALLAEVHELRLAMERSATIAPRAQLTLARLNIQEQAGARGRTALSNVELIASLLHKYASGRLKQA